MLVPPGPDYKDGMEVKAGLHLEIYPLGQAPDHREEYDPPTGWAHKGRKLDDPRGTS